PRRSRHRGNTQPASRRAIAVLPGARAAGRRVLRAAKKDRLRQQLFSRRDDKPSEAFSGEGRMLRVRPLMMVGAALAGAALAGAALGCDEPPRARTVADAGVVDAAVALAETGPPATAMGDALAAAGLDATALPPFDELDAPQVAAVMDTFTRALGLGCADCHEADAAVPTPRTRIAKKMWDRLARGLVRRDGGALYCDSCHDGRATFLDRSDARIDGALGRWMQASYVTPLVRRDGA